MKPVKLLLDLIRFSFCFLLVATLALTLAADEPSTADKTLAPQAADSSNGTSKPHVSASKAKKGSPPSATEALAILKAGNERFVSGKARHPHEDANWRTKLTKGQHPFATVLGCSDSRVCPELIFDEGLGDLFVIRVAGNIVDEDVKASVEYAVEHLDTHLVVVLGHENCGAVTAAISPEAKEPRELNKLIRRIHDNVCEHHDGEPDVDGKTDIHTAVCKNVMCSCRRLKDCRALCRCIEKHDVRVVGAIYDLKTGKVRWMDEKQK